MTILIPATFSAGVDFNLSVTTTAYPAPDWSLSLHLRGLQGMDFSASGDGCRHIFREAASATKDWAAGKYWYSLRAKNGQDTIEIQEGQLSIRPDLAGMDGGYDGRDHAEKVLEAVEAVIEGRATRDQERYKINNRELQRTPLQVLLDMRKQYKIELSRKRRIKKTGNSLVGRQVKVRL